MRFTILADSRSAVIGIVLAAIGVLPLVVVPTADPYQPVRALAVAAAAGILVLLVRTSVAGPRLRRSIALVAFLAALFVLSAVTNGAPSAVFGVHGRFQGLVSGAAVLLAGIAGVVAGGVHIRRFGWVLAVTGVVMALLMTTQWLGGVEPQAWTNSRVVAGGWLAVAGSVVAAAALTTRGRERAALTAALVPMVLALGLSGSRGAWVGAAAGAFAVMAVGRRVDLRSIALLGVAVALVAAGALAGGADSAGKLDPRSLGTGSASSRLLIWRGAADMVAVHPLLGVGPGRFIYEFPAFQPPQHAVIEAPDTRPDNAHSALFHMAAETGVPAALCWVALVGLAASGGVTAARGRDGVALLAVVGLAAYVGQSLFSVPSIEVDALGALFMGVCLARSDRLGDLPSGQRSGAAATAVALVLSLAVCAAAIVYLAADSAYRASTAYFAQGDSALASREAKRAVTGNPLVDVYRVALSDTVVYSAPGASRERAAAEVEPVLAEGLRLEPRSYDLALARARVKAAVGADAGSVAEAYLEAVALYPLGVEVREAAAGALRRAGRDDEAARIERELARQRTLRGEG